MGGDTLIKYTVHCPQCSGDRKKKHLKPCTAIEFPQGTSYKCFHCGYKEFVRNGKVTEFTSKEETTPQIESVPILNNDRPFNGDQYTFYPYYNDKGDLKCYVVRSGDKDNKWIRPFMLTADGWVSQKPNDIYFYTPTGLQDKSKPIVIVEGEKSADVAKTVLTTAEVVTWIGGANNLSLDKFSVFKDRTVYIWPDNDEVGINAANKIADSIPSENVYILGTSHLPVKADIADLVVNGEVDTQSIKTAFETKKHVEKYHIQDLYNINKYKEWAEAYKYKELLGYKTLDNNSHLPPSGIVVGKMVVRSLFKILPISLKGLFSTSYKNQKN